jgi:hypothetical protein
MGSYTGCFVGLILKSVQLVEKLFRVAVQRVVGDEKIR